MTKKEGGRTLAWGFSHYDGWFQHYWECWLDGLEKSFWPPNFDHILLLDQPESIECLKWDFELAKAGIEPLVICIRGGGPFEPLLERLPGAVPADFEIIGLNVQPLCHLSRVARLKFQLVDQLSVFRLE